MWMRLLGALLLSTSLALTACGGGSNTDPDDTNDPGDPNDPDDPNDPHDSNDPDDPDDPDGPDPDDPEDPPARKVTVQVDWLPTEADGQSTGVTVTLWVENEYRGELVITEPGAFAFDHEFSAGTRYELSVAINVNNLDYEGICRFVDAPSAYAFTFAEPVTHELLCRRVAKIAVAVQGLSGANTVGLTLDTDERANSVAVPFSSDVGNATVDLGGQWVNGDYTLSVSRQPAAFERCLIADPESTASPASSLSFAFDAFEDLTLSVSCEQLPPPEPGWTETPVEALFKAVQLSWRPIEGATFTILDAPVGQRSIILGSTGAPTFTIPVSLHLPPLPRVVIRACAGDGNCTDSAPLELETALTDAQKERLIGYLKPETPVANARFGAATAVTLDGQWMAVGAPDEPVDADNSGAVYLFRREASGWSLVSRTDLSGFGTANRGHGFGTSVSIVIKDGFPVIAVGVPRNAIRCTGVSWGIDCLTAPDNQSAPDSGAVYVLRHATGSTQLMAAIKPHNTHADGAFGASVALSQDALYLVVGAPGDRGAQSGPVTGARNNPPPGGFTTNLVGSASLADSGAVFVFTGDGSSNLNYQQTAYIKDPMAMTQDAMMEGSELSLGGGGLRFGTSMALSPTGRWLVVGSPGDRSLALGVFTTPLGNRGSITTAPVQTGSASVWAFEPGPAWSIRAWLRGEVPTDSDSRFGEAVAVGFSPELARLTVAAGAPLTHVQADSGKVFLYQGFDLDGFTSGADLLQPHTATDLSETAGPLIGGAGERLGSSVSFGGDGSFLAVGLGGADRVRLLRTTGLDFLPVGIAEAGGVNVRRKFDVNMTGFGTSVALSHDARTLVVGAPGENCSGGGFSLQRESCGATVTNAGAVFVH